ncbi:MAG: hypothetical protein ACFHU9_14310 [Fluviicola sp.]
MNSNIVTIKSSCLNKETVAKFGLVPDNHIAPRWYKIVVMEHVELEHLTEFLEEVMQIEPQLS